MAKISAGSIATDITINEISATSSLKQLRQAVTATTQAWKIQQAELRSAGKASEAAAAKYQGLSKSVEAQRKALDQLKARQAEYQNAMKSTNRETDEGKQKYKNLQAALERTNTEINKSATRLASLTAQRDKAKRSMDYQSTGLAKLQKEYRTTTNLSRSYVERLQSEGKNYQANVAKINGYKNSISNLTKQYQIQEKELVRIASESGRTSTAFKVQQARVNETATAINKAKASVSNLEKENRKLSPTGFNKFAAGAKKVTDSATKIKTRFKGTWENIKTGAGVAAAGIGAVGVAAVSGAKKAGELQQVYKEITNLATLGGEKQSEAIRNVTKMQSQGREMSIQYGKSQQEIAEAYEELIKRGYTTKQALGAMKTELQGSVASGDDFKDVVSVSSTTLEAFGMRANTTAKMTENTKRVVNELAYAADMTSTGFKDLGYGLAYTGSSAHQAGISLSMTASAMGILSNNGLEASKAGTGLNQVINRLSSSAAKLAKGDKKNALAQLGISPKEIMNSKGQLKDLSTVFGVINKHMEGMSKVKKIDMMESLFGMNGEQAGLILAENSKELGELSKKTLQAGKDGQYVAKLSEKNSQTAKMQVARLKQTSEAFSMTLGAKMLPAINKAGTELVVFLTKSKDGKKLTNDFAKAVEAFSNGLVSMIEWIAKHKTETKLIATGFGAAYGVVKIASFVQWINKTRLAFQGLNVISHTAGVFKKLGSALKLSGKLFKATGKGIAFAGKTMGKSFVKQLKLIGKGVSSLGKGILKAAKAVGKEAVSAGKFLGQKLSDGFKGSVKFGKGLFGKGNGAGTLNGLLQSARSAGGFKNLSTAGKIGTGLAGAGVAIDAGSQFLNAYKDRHSADKRSTDIGKGIGAGIGGGIGLWFGGPLGAAVGVQIGKAVGGWGGQAVNKFTKGWQSHKPPKSFWSLENLGYSAHNMWNGFTKGVSNTIKWFKKNWKEIGVYFISPLAGAINSLYKHNAKFRKWVNGLVKSFKKAWKGITKWFSNLGKDIQKSWKGMTKWFSNLGKSMVKGLKAAWKGVTKWFSNIAKGIQKAWKGMTSWFSKLGSNMSKGLKKTWHTMTKWFSDIGKGIQKSWSGMTKWFTKLGSGTVKGFKKAWHGITSWFSGIIKGIKDAWDGFWDKISGPIKTIQKAFSGKLNIGGIHFASGTDWRKRYGIPAVVNDAPGYPYREALIDTDGSIKAFPNKRNLNFLLKPGQDIINATDLAKMMPARFANGTVKVHNDDKHLSNIDKKISESLELSKKKESDAKTRRSKLESERKDLKERRKKLSEEIQNALKKGYNTKSLVTKFNDVNKKLSENRKNIAKTDPHHGMVYVDQGLLIGAKDRVGTSTWISQKLYDQLTKTKKKTRKRKTKKRKTKKRSTSTRTRTRSTSSTRSRSTRSTRTRSTVTASVTGLGSVTSLAKVIKYVSGTHKATIEASTKGLSTKGLKNKSIKISVKISGKKALSSLKKAIRDVKGKKVKVAVKVSGSKSLKSLAKAISNVKKTARSLDKTTSKLEFGKLIKKQAEKAVKSLKGSGNFAKTFNSLTKKFTSDLKKMASNAEKHFKQMWDKLKSTSKSSESTINRNLSTFSNRFTHGFKSLQNGVRNAFYRFWKIMAKDAKGGLNSVINLLNSSISRIDKVVSEFGGSKNAVHRVPRLATGTGALSGTRRAITKPTIAMLNDGEDSPETGNRETIWDTRTNKFEVVEGRNRFYRLFPGQEVLNATESRELGFTKLATGTGALKKLYEQAKKYWEHPVKTGQALFGNLTGKSGAVGQIAKGMNKKGENQGVKWWSQLWKMAEDKINDDDLGAATGLLKAVEKLGRNKRYSLGKRMSKFFADCSSLVSRALASTYGATWATPNGQALTVAGLWQHAHRISEKDAKPGDPVFWLPDTHVGVYAGHGKYYSAYGPNDGGPVGMQSVGPGAVFGRFNGLNTRGSKSDKDPEIKANGKLQKQIKSQVGKGFWRTIQKIADKYGESGMAAAFKLGGDVTARARAIAKALKQAVPGATRSGLAGVIGSWIFESGGLNPAIVNPNGGASGLGQWLDSRLTNLKAYAKRMHKSWTDPSTQINFAVNQEGSDSATLRRILKSNASASETALEFSRLWERGGYDAQHASAARDIYKSLRGFANGGITDQPAIFGEAGPEMAIPLIPSKSTRAWELIGKAISILSGQNGQNKLSTANVLQQQEAEKDRQEEREFRDTVLMLLTQLVNKSNVAEITLKTPAGRALWSVVEPFQKAEMKSEITKLRRGLSGRR